MSEGLRVVAVDQFGNFTGDFLDCLTSIDLDEFGTHALERMKNPIRTVLHRPPARSLHTGVAATRNVLFARTDLLDRVVLDAHFEPARCLTNATKEILVSAISFFRPFARALREAPEAAGGPVIATAGLLTVIGHKQTPRPAAGGRSSAPYSPSPTRSRRSPPRTPKASQAPLGAHGLSLLPICADFHCFCDQICERMTLEKSFA